MRDLVVVMSSRLNHEIQFVSRIRFDLVFGTYTFCDFHPSLLEEFSFRGLSRIALSCRRNFQTAIGRDNECHWMRLLQDP